MPKPGVACQLYTVRALTHADFAGTIRALASNRAIVPLSSLAMGTWRIR